MTQLSIQDALQLGLQNQRAGRLNEAAVLYRQVLEIAPRQADALHLLGLVQFQLGNPAAAIDLIRQAIAVNPQFAAFHNNLGNVLKILGRVEEAIGSYETAFRIDPKLGGVYQNLVGLLEAKGQIERMIEVCRAMIAAAPNMAEPWNRLGNLLSARYQTAEAAVALRHAVELQPDFAVAWSNLGDELVGLGKLEEAIEACRTAVKLDPGSFGAYNNLGNALRMWGATAEAIAAYQQAISLNSKSAVVYNNLGNALGDQARIEEATEAYRRAQRIEPNSPEIHSNLLSHLNGTATCSVREVYQEHRRWDELHAQRLMPSGLRHANNTDPDRRLRIGYVSPDFRRHSVSYFAESFLAHHDHGRFEVFCYADKFGDDEITRRVQGFADTWRTVTALSDADLANRVREDRIDILIDLTGHQLGGRLRAFARKPAPVQATYLGYPATTGLSAMDYRITDALSDPPGQTEELHSEKLIRLPRCFLCYHLSHELPKVGPLPVLEAGHVTFGCFNNFVKVNEFTLALWARLLEAVPNARLMLKYRSLGDERTQDLVRERFAAHGVAAERVQMYGHVRGFAEHLALYGRVDVALDPFPYHGTTTTCEALAMGVPVITLAGDAHISRVGVSLLNHLGRKELIAETQEQYVEIARNLAGDLDRLATLRSGLRQRMRTSPLCNEAAFTQDLEHVYRQMWSQWCEGKQMDAN